MEKRRTDLGSFGRISQIMRVEYNSLFNFRNWCDEEGLQMISGFENDEVNLEPFTAETPKKTVDEITSDISKLEDFIKLLKDVRTGDEIRAIESKHEAKRQQTAETINKNVQVEMENVAHAKAVVAENYQVREAELRAKYEEEINKIKAAQAEAELTNPAMTPVYEEK